MEWEQEQLRRGGNRGYPPESQVPIKAIYKPAPSTLVLPPLRYFLTETLI
jgi:hypothetical protein